MTDLARSYMLIALAWLLLGMVEGFWMGASNALEYRSVHISMVLQGFVNLAVYGAVYRLWPQLQAGRWARLQFWSTNIGTVLIVLGTLQQALTGSVVVVATGSALAIIGACTLVYPFATATAAAGSGARSEAAYGR